MTETTDPKTTKLDRRQKKVDLQKARVELRKAEAELEKALVELAKTKDEAEENKHSDEANHVYTLKGDINSGTVWRCIRGLSQWGRQGAESITLIINSPGGLAVQGLALVDTIAALNEAGSPVTTIVRGAAYSMGGVILQAGEYRVMGKNSTLLIHQPSAGSYGKTPEIEDDLEYVKIIEARLVNVLTEKSNLTPKQLRKRWHRRDWTLCAEEALELGFVDAIG